MKRIYLYLRQNRLELNRLVKEAYSLLGKVELDRVRASDTLEQAQLEANIVYIRQLIKDWEFELQMVTAKVSNLRALNREKISIITGIEHTNLLLRKHQQALLLVVSSIRQADLIKRISEYQKLTVAHENELGAVYKEIGQFLTQ